MGWIGWIGSGLALLAAMSAGIALGLHLIVPRWSERRRALVAAGIAAFLPMSLAFGGFFTESAEMLSEDSDGFLLGLLALCVLQVILWAIVALPPAWFVTHRLSCTGSGREELSGVSCEPDLIEG